MRDREAEKVERPTKKSAVWNRFALTVVVTLLVFVITELVSAAYGLVKFGTSCVEDLYALEPANSYIRDIEARGDTYGGTLLPHPYLGFVKRPGKGVVVNNIGLMGPDVPYEKKEDTFVVMVTGGSVASQLVCAKDGGEPILATALRDRLKLGGRGLLVLNGACGAWRQPQQTILMALYADNVDAVISIEGFNEHYVLGWEGVRFDYPPTSFRQVSPASQTSYDELAALWIGARIRQVCRSSSVLSRLRCTWFFAHVVRGFLSRSAVSARRQEGGHVWQQDAFDATFNLPSHWDEARCYRYNMTQYRKYLRTMACLGQRKAIHLAVFLQPVPAIDRHLSAQEMSVVGNLSYGPLYQRMVRDLMVLRDEGFSVHDLGDVFANCAEPVYADAIHCLQEGPEGGSIGYTLMARRIAETLAEEWSMSKNPGDLWR